MASCLPPSQPVAVSTVKSFLLLWLVDSSLVDGQGSISQSCGFASRLPLCYFITPFTSDFLLRSAFQVINVSEANELASICRCLSSTPAPAAAAQKCLFTSSENGTFNVRQRKRAE